MVIAKHHVEWDTSNNQALVLVEILVNNVMELVVNVLEQDLKPVVHVKEPCISKVLLNNAFNLLIVELDILLLI